MKGKKSPLEVFFSLGEKVTGGDPKKLMDWNFYMLAIMFIAFLSILIGNVIEFYRYQKLASIGWAVVMLAILWFQYQSLKQIYETRKMMKTPEVQQNLNEMLEEFKEEVKGGKHK